MQYFMMRSIRQWLGAVFGAVIVLSATTTPAQVIGTFRWQFAPYCNVVTLQVKQDGAAFQLSGTDDQCGAGVVAAANGSAHVNPNGTIGVALTVVRPDGQTMPGTATLNLATISGAWRDQYGNSGAFLFNPASSPAGDPRRVRLTGNLAIAFRAAANSAPGFAPISFGTVLATPPVVHIIPVGGPPTAQCPGSVSAPLAAPGHLCVFKAYEQNVGIHVVLDGSINDGADTSGASVGAVRGCG